MVVVVKMTKHT